MVLTLEGIRTASGLEKAFLNGITEKFLKVIGKKE